MKAQISLEVMIAMSVSLLLLLAVLNYFSGANALLRGTQREIAGIAASSYQAIRSPG